MMLIEIETTFRSLKTELDMRPIYHQEERVTGPLFISLLAYHLVHTLRYQLKQQAQRQPTLSLQGIKLFSVRSGCLKV